MESIYLKTFIEIARTGSFTRAAENLCVTQSAISRRIKYLETQYGHDLLDRSALHLVLTPHGKVVLEKAQKIMQIEKELHSALNFTEAEKKVSFVCTPTFGIVHLPSIMHKFMLSFPDSNSLQFTFKMPNEIVSALQKGVYDIAVIEHCGPLNVPGFETISLDGDEMLFVSTPEIRAAIGDAGVENILNHTLYTRAEGCCSRILLESNLQQLGHNMDEFSRVIIYDDLHVIIDSLLNNGGIGFLSSELVAPYVNAGRLETFKIKGFNHSRSRTFVYADSSSLGCLSFKFKEFLITQFNSTAQG